MKRGTLTRYFCNDLYRIFCSPEIYLGVLGVAFSMFLSLENPMNMSGSVIDTLLLATYGAGFHLTFLFCALPYANVFVEDLDTYYGRYSVIRGNLKKYMAAKLASIFISSILAMSAGCLLFAFIQSAYLPWIDETWKDTLAGGGNLWMLEKGWYIPWIVMYGVQWGFAAGTLAAVASVCSLYISNKMLILALPILFYQALTEIGTFSFRNIKYLDLVSVFDARFNLFGNDGLMILWAFFLGISVTVLMGMIAYQKMKKRM